MGCEAVQVSQREGGAERNVPELSAGMFGLPLARPSKGKAGEGVAVYVGKCVWLACIRVCVCARVCVCVRNRVD